jgi:hypothetical protein
MTVTLAFKAFAKPIPCLTIRSVRAQENIGVHFGAPLLVNIFLKK